MCLPGRWNPLLFLKDEEYDRGIASNTGMNELPGCWGWEVVMWKVEVESLLNFILQSKLN
jgi:hypothetical protein